MRLFCARRRMYTIRGKWLLLFFIGLSIFASCLFIYNTCYSSTIKEKARVKANFVAHSAINKAVETLLAEDTFHENSFFVVEKKQDGTVASVMVNTKTTNLFKASFSEIILEKISEYGKEEIYMSPFSAYGYTYVPFGIRIPVLVIPIEILFVDFDSKLISGGINQTLFRMDVHVKIIVKLLLPVGSEAFEIQTTVPLAQTVIVGDIPGSYTNVEGVEDTGPNTILDIAS